MTAETAAYYTILTAIDENDLAFALTGEETDFIGGILVDRPDYLTLAQRTTIDHLYDTYLAQGDDDAA
jgi:hypothetical protein